MKEWLLEWGYLCFDDAYFLASVYLQKFPHIKKLLQKRFRFVLIDETQDMDKHQHDILEEIFFKKYILRHCYQRIGDKNQAIFNGDVKLNDIWNESGRKKLKLKGSHRLTEEIAKVVKFFGLDYQEVKGLKEDCGIKPHIIVFEDPKEVLPKFTKLIKENNLTDNEHPFCAIGWTGDYRLNKEKTGPDKSKLTIKCYHENFEKNHHKPKIDYQCLKDYLKYYDKKDNSLAPIRKNILNVFIKILRIENKKDDNDRNYTIKKFINFVKEKDFVKYKELKLKLFEWSLAIKKGEEVYEDIKNYIKPFLESMFSDITFSQQTDDFINLSESSNIESHEEEARHKENNFFESDGIKIKIGTVHSVKGETHTATLYMESFHKRGRGNYESERLIDQLKENKQVIETVKDIKNSKDLVRQSAKMVYVGFSRPTHLLCFAVHKKRIDNNFNNENWEIIKE